MTTAKKTDVTADAVTMEQALTELQEAQTSVDEAQKTLEEAKSTQSEKVEQIKSLMDQLAEKAKELGLEIVANVSEASVAVQEKLDDAKNQWEETASTNPNEARRQVRLVWAVLGVVAGFVVGGGVGFLCGRIF